MRTIQDFELPLLKMGVEILRVRQSYSGGIQVVGKINSKIYTWTGNGQCFIGKYRVSKLDIEF